MFDKIAKKLDINWHGAWRKILYGAACTALMGYTYKQNKAFDEKMDVKYPGPRAQREQAENEEDIPTS